MAWEAADGYENPNTTGGGGGGGGGSSDDAVKLVWSGLLDYAGQDLAALANLPEGAHVRFTMAADVGGFTPGGTVSYYVKSDGTAQAAGRVEFLGVACTGGTFHFFLNLGGGGSVPATVERVA